MAKQDTAPDRQRVNRRRFLQLSGLGLAGAAAGALNSPAHSAASEKEAPAEAARPNIVLLIADDAGWRDVGYNGSEIDTPNIDRLAQGGTVLEQFYACPTCSPTRAAILLGRPPSRFGILEPIAGRSRQSLPAGTPTLATVLGGAGYFTAQIGKWHLGLTPQTGPRHFGFDSSYGYLHGQLDQYSHIYKNGDRTWHRNEEYIEEKGHVTDLIAAEAVRLIRESRPERPFFLYTAFSVPHYPLQEEERWTLPYADRIDEPSRRLYAASMAHMDDAIGRILAAVKEKNLASGTLVIFISDNGAQRDWVPQADEYGKRHGPNAVLGDNRPFRDWKGSVYEGGIRVPAVFYQPGERKSGRLGLPAHVMDLLPTLAGYAGARIPEVMQVEGIDLRPALAGRPPAGERNLYWNTGGQLALRRGDWKLIQNGDSLVEGTVELYDIEHDPYEKNDLSRTDITRVTQMRESLAAERAMDEPPG